MSQVVLLDSSFLAAYATELTRNAQAFVMDTIADGDLLVSTASSVAVTISRLPDITEILFLLEDPAAPVTVLPLSQNAVEVGEHLAAGPGKTIEDFEAAHVVCEARAAGAVVMTYTPDSYRPYPPIDIVDMRPR